MNKQSVKHNLIFIGFSLGILLPARLLFNEFVSDHWLGNLGVITSIGFLLIFLIRKNKLGTLGKIFEKQLISTINGKTGKYIIVISCVFLSYFGTTLILIEHGNTIYAEDTELFYNHIVNNADIEKIPIQDIHGPAITDANLGLFNTVFVLDYAFSVTYAMINEMSHNWVSHLYSVLFVEQIEILALLFFVRKSSSLQKILFFPKTSK